MYIAGFVARSNRSKVINRDGFRSRTRFSPAIRKDRTTLSTMLDRLAERIGLKEGATVVLDRGMAFE